VARCAGVCAYATMTLERLLISKNLRSSLLPSHRGESLSSFLLLEYFPPSTRRRTPWTISRRVAKLEEATRDLAERPAADLLDRSAPLLMASRGNARSPEAWT